jgi:hypothetical protein
LEDLHAVELYERELEAMGEPAIRNIRAERREEIQRRRAARGRGRRMGDREARKKHNVLQSGTRHERDEQAGGGGVFATKKR